ncbi:hypothetical protein CCAX7_21920 [Capsulimonas corticalis]|uniref:Diguanylate cyclase n=2 Tax=Capsulimonas corticalis TaxID=2219043 RepID=A0A9N7QAV2_9BACT|nr:hypothetical protein CCAX7_21920 [Capsulimonas corticalis]
MAAALGLAAGCSLIPSLIGHPSPLLSAGLSLVPIAYLGAQFGRSLARNRVLERDVALAHGARTQQETAYQATVQNLALAVSARDQEAYEHVLRVQRFAVAIAARLGLSAEEQEAIAVSALLHDVGKLGVPEYVLLKTGRLTPAEYEIVKKHSVIGANLLEPIPFPWPVAPAVKHHHERIDGTGYPDGLAGDEIPLSARILAVADVYDALTSRRSYRDAWSEERARQYLCSNSGRQFDHEVVNAFLQVVRELEPALEAAGNAPAAHGEARTDFGQAARQIHRMSVETWALHEVAQVLASNMGIDATLAHIVQKVESVFPGCAALFLQKDALDGPLLVRVACGVNHAYFEGMQASGEGGVTDRVARTKKGYLGVYRSGDLIHPEAGACPDMREWVSLKSALVVPVVVEGELLGALNLYHPEADAFSSGDRKLLTMIADRIGPAVYNGLLFERARSHALTDTLTGLYNMRYFTNYVADLCEHCQSLAGEIVDGGAADDLEIAGGAAIEAAPERAYVVEPYNPFGAAPAPCAAPVLSVPKTAERPPSRPAGGPLTRRLIRHGQTMGSSEDSEGQETPFGLPGASPSFPEAATKPFSKTRRREFALLYLDLNNFKPINDNYGHPKGDRVLRDLAGVFREAVREPDVIARYGGDEFVVALHGADRGKAEEVAVRLRGLVESYDPGLTPALRDDLHLSVSIGVSCFPADGSDFAALLSSADKRMFRAKDEHKQAHGLSAGRRAA